ncbi:hypothetical protein [Prochlorococcus sp. MIT 1306]|uniref:hypothetical protein n=1 Tax=Prochlorococcus sp. MIT 1306 TaxID=1799667 RepID=UPI0012E8FC46|nr:hypothetical protein [Prochlorococcus sp. MIT 1306]
MRASDAVLYFRLEPKALYLYGGGTCCGARDSIQRGLSSLVTNEVVMIIEVKAIASGLSFLLLWACLLFGGSEHWLMGRLLSYEGIGHTGGG